MGWGVLKPIPSTYQGMTITNKILRNLTWVKEKKTHENLEVKLKNLIKIMFILCCNLRGVPYLALCLKK